MTRQQKAQEVARLMAVLDKATDLTCTTTDSGFVVMNRDKNSYTSDFLFKFFKGETISLRGINGLFDSLVGCRLCTDCFFCENCIDSKSCGFCKDTYFSFYSYSCNDCAHSYSLCECDECYGCKVCIKSKNLAACVSCLSCVACDNAKECISCKDCTNCWGLINATSKRVERGNIEEMQNRKDIQLVKRYARYERKFLAKAKRELKKGLDNES